MEFFHKPLNPRRKLKLLSNWLPTVITTDSSLLFDRWTLTLLLCTLSPQTFIFSFSDLSLSRAYCLKQLMSSLFANSCCCALGRRVKSTTDVFVLKSNIENSIDWPRGASSCQGWLGVPHELPDDVVDWTKLDKWIGSDVTVTWHERSVWTTVDQEKHVSRYMHTLLNNTNKLFVARVIQIVNDIRIFTNSDRRVKSLVAANS